MKVALMKHLQASVMIHLVYADESSPPKKKTLFLTPVQLKCLKMHVLESQKCLGLSWFEFTHYPQPVH